LVISLNGIGIQSNLLETSTPELIQRSIKRGQIPPRLPRPKFTEDLANRSHFALARAVQV